MFETWPLLLGKSVYSHKASIHPGVQMDTGELNAGDNPMMDKYPIQGGVQYS